MIWPRTGGCAARVEQWRGDEQRCSGRSLVVPMGVERFRVSGRTRHALLQVPRCGAIEPHFSSPREARLVSLPYRPTPPLPPSISLADLPGLPRRLWLALLSLLSILGFFRLIFSSSSSSSSNPYSAPHTLLTPRDYLNASASDPAPFDFCPVFGPGDAVAERRGQWGLLRTRLHMGSGARVQKVIQKAMKGLPVTISVLGGSGESSFLLRPDARPLRFILPRPSPVPAYTQYPRLNTCSIGMPRRRRRPHRCQMLPRALLRLVELGLSPSRVGIDERRGAHDRLGVLCLLLDTSSARPDRLGHSRV